MTLYIAAYDTESPACLEACRRIVEAHHRHAMPATFFLMGETLAANPNEYRQLLDDPLFEIASHTYSHKMLRDHPWCGPQAAPAKLREEIFRGKALIEEVFGRPCIGLRPGCSFVDGLRGEPGVLALVQEAGYRYVSSVAWGPDYSLPAPLNQPFRYTDDGYGDLWELPCHGWHENLLKDNNHWGPRRVVLFPPVMPESIPDHFIATPAEEFHYNNRPFIAKAVTEGLPSVSLIWHPWSLYAFDPDMAMLDITFRHIREQGIRAGTYADLLAMCQAQEVGR